MPGRWMHRVPGHGAKATHQYRLSGRQPGQASRGIAPLIITHPILPHLATGLPPLVHPARKGPTRGAPPLTILPLPAGTVRQAGGCIQPVLLRGRVDHIDGATGELLHRYSTVHEPGGVLPVACKTRRASRCPPCAEVYSADTYQLIRAGLSGGKGVPDTRRHPPVRVHHPHRALLRPGPPLPGERRPAPALPSAPARPDLPAWPTHVLR